MQLLSLYENAPVASDSEVHGYREQILDDPRAKLQPPAQAVGVAVAQPRTA